MCLSTGSAFLSVTYELIRATMPIEKGLADFAGFREFVRVFKDGRVERQSLTWNLKPQFALKNIRES